MNEYNRTLQLTCDEYVRNKEKRRSLDSLITCQNILGQLLQNNDQYILYKKGE